VERAVRLDREGLLAAPDARVDPPEVDREQSPEPVDVRLRDLLERGVAVLVRRVAEASPAYVAFCSERGCGRREHHGQDDQDCGQPGRWIRLTAPSDHARPSYEPVDR